MLRKTPKLYVLLIFLSLFLIGVSFPKTTLSQHDDKVRIGIVFKSSTTGFRYRDGIINGLGDTSRFVIVEKPYIMSAHGEDTIKKLIRNNEVDVILGPTESEVFTKVYNTDGISDNKITVISGLATTNVGNDSQGFFFRLNLEATSRVFEMWSYMNKFWVSKIAIVYEDSEFGRNAEMAFSEIIRESNTDLNYMNIAFESPLVPFADISNIIKERPEIIGLFCEREDVEMLYKNIHKLNNTGVPYNPAFFTIIDITTVGDGLRNFYFPSLQNYQNATLINPNIEDEVYILGVETGNLLQKAIAKSGPDNYLKTATDRLSFRNQVVGILLGETNADLNMKFLKMKNLSPPHLYKLDEQEVFKIDQNKEIHWIVMIHEKIKMVYATQSYKLILNLILMFILTISVSSIEIRRSFPKKHVKIYFTGVFYYYLLAHLLLVLFLYIFLAETGRINYYDTIMVIIISITPSAFFKTTFFESRSGKSIGLESIYKRIMASIDEEIMKSRYKKLVGLENVIAYSNSVDSMRRALKTIYRNNPSNEQAAKMTQKLEEDLAQEGDYMNRRRIAAKLIMRQFSKEQLKAEGFVPTSWQYGDSIDPIILIRHAAKHCSRNDESRGAAMLLYKSELENLKLRNEARYNEIMDFHEKEMNLTMTNEGTLLVKLRLLIVLRGFDRQWMVDNHLIDQKDIDNLRADKRRTKNNDKHFIKKMLSTFANNFKSKGLDSN